MTPTFTHLATLPAKNHIGECVLWDDRRQQIVWTDIPARRLWMWRLEDPAPEVVVLPDCLASFALTETPGHFIGAFASGFAAFDATGAIVRELAWVTEDDAGITMNDGRVDRSGRFWATTKLIDLDDPDPRGKLWGLNPDGGATSCLGKMKVPNGLAFSLDGRSMYLADSEAAMIWRYGLDRDGPLVGAPFVTVAPGIKPDGACIDADGRLWSAHWGAGAVVCYEPDGSEAARLQLPVSRPTCVAFGGPDLDLLLITSASDDLDHDEPLAGSLFVYRTNARGVAESRCTGAFVPAAVPA